MKLNKIEGTNYQVEFTDDFGNDWVYSLTDKELKQLGKLIAEKIIGRAKLGTRMPVAKRKGKR